MAAGGRAQGLAVDAAAASPVRALARRPVVWRLASLALVFGAWEIAGRVPISPVFPTFGATFVAFVELLVDGSFAVAYASTARPLALGLLISTMSGLGIGIAMGLSRRAEWLAAPVFIVLQAAPMAALVPLITYVYGIGVAAKTFAVIMLALPVIALNGYKAIRNASPTLIAMCRSFLGTRGQQVLKVILPDASPLIFAGLRLGVAAGFIGVVLAELLITPTGIGDLITYHRSIANYPEMYATVASILLVSTLTLATLQVLEVQVLRPEKRRR